MSTDDVRAQLERVAKLRGLSAEEFALSVGLSVDELLETFVLAGFESAFRSSMFDPPDTPKSSR